MYFGVRLFFLGIVLSIASNDVLGAYFYEPEVRGWLNVYRIAANFLEAKETCHSEGAELAAPTTKEMAMTMKELIAFNGFTSSFYIDAAQHERGVFLSSQNISLTDMEVDGKFANLDYSKGDCIALNPTELRAVPCDTPLNYICYKKDDRSVQRIQCGTDDPGYKLNKTIGSCYKLHETFVTWDVANATCASEGTYLVILNDAIEAQAIAAMKFPVEGNYVPFMIIGLHGRMGDNADWFYVDGTPVDKLYNNWYGWTPSDGSSRCGLLTKSGKLADWNCSAKHGFVCEKNA